MSPSRRDFIRGVGVTAAASALYSRDLVAELIAQAPSGRVLESRFKGLADIALVEAKTAGSSYADIRFTMTTNPPGATANFRAPGDAAGRGGAGGAGGGRGGGGGGGGSNVGGSGCGGERTGTADAQPPGGECAEVVLEQIADGEGPGARGVLAVERR